MYEIKIKVDADDIYNRLTASEKERFEDVVITDINRNGNEILITGIAIEKKRYDEEKYKRLLEKEHYLEEGYALLDETPLRRLCS